MFANATVLDGGTQEEVQGGSAAVAAAVFPLSAPQVSESVVRVIEALEPTRQAIFEAQTAYGQTRWNEHLAVDLRLAGARGGGERGSKGRGVKREGEGEGGRGREGGGDRRVCREELVGLQ